MRNAFDKLDAALRRIASSEDAVKVRELEWLGELDRDPEYPAWTANNPFGLSYRIVKAWWGARNKWAFVYGSCFHDTVDEAKAAAQSDYEARIKSALVEVPAVKGEPEPVAWRDIIKQPDERPLPTYGQIPWAQLGRDVNDATFGRRADFEFSDKVYPGHQMVLGINFNSLARIVDKYRYYGLPCAAKPYTAPPADAGMREALIGLNYSLDRYWEGDRSDNRVKEICDWQLRCRDALTAPGATSSKRHMLECILLSLNVDGVDLNGLTVGELRRAL